MRHIIAVTARRLPVVGDEYTTLTAVLSLVSSVMGLLEQVSTVFGVDLGADKKAETSA